jgi:hypothetical protein
MVSFVIETFVAEDAQGHFAAEADGIRVAAEAFGAGGQVRLVRSYLVPGDGMGFHVIEAKSVDDVARVAQRAGVDAERIVEAIRVEPGVPRPPGR